INNGTVTTAVNTTLCQRKGVMSRLQMSRNAITGSHTKMIVLPQWEQFVFRSIMELPVSVIFFCLVLRVDGFVPNIISISHEPIFGEKYGRYSLDNELTSFFGVLYY
ncbi:MAG: hypothetical protein EZS28_040864, partial [Streblomastix strix]